MPLNRITIATHTLHEFIKLSPAKQKILVFLLERRRMYDKPLRPTNFFSYNDIAEETGLKADSVRVLILDLTKNEWLQVINERRMLTPKGKIEKQFRWCVKKVVKGLDEAYKVEKEQRESPEFVHPDDDPAQFAYEGHFWRQGGAFGWQSRNQVSINGDWNDRSNPPSAVVEYFKLSYGAD